MAVQPVISFTLLLIAALPATGQVCSQPRNPDFYQNNGYAIRRIEIRNPFSFIFLVRHQMNEIKNGLSIAEGQPFSTTKYNESAKYVEDAVYSDDSLGSSRAKLVAKIVSIENCYEKDDAPKTVDVVYRIFSTDPIPSVRALPEKRQSAVDEPATNAVEDGTKAFYKFRPLFGYEDARRGYGGVDFLLRIPGQIFEDLHLVASGSPTSRIIQFQLDGSKTQNLRALDRVEYHLAYNYSKLPAANLRLAKGSFQARFTGFSKPLGSYHVSLRYGASVELGNQQGHLTKIPRSDTVTNSAYGTVRVYAGITKTTRHSEAAMSYGLQIGGAGLGELSFVRQVGDVVYSRQFPGGTHSPWDVQMRLSVGGITGSRGILLNERFFGGNSVSNFNQGDVWFIPSGPIVRSIANNRLSGEGFGGTSFYSANLTIGKVIMSRPLIPRDIEEADGFGSSIEASENSAESWFKLDYLTSSPEYTQLVTEYAPKLKADVDTVQDTLKAIRATGAVMPGLEKVLKEAEHRAKLTQNSIRSATVPDARGRVNASQLNVLGNPTTSPLLKLIAVFPKLQPLVSPEVNPRLVASQGSINQHLTELRTALNAIQVGPVGQEAAMKAHRDMARPREIIDTLRREVNRYSFSLVGIFDSGRVWPDPFSTRYAIGAGGRFSLLNVNLTAGYAFNPHPRMELGQGRGAMIFSLSYTNLFR